MKQGDKCLVCQGKYMRESLLKDWWKVSEGSAREKVAWIRLSLGRGNVGQGWVQVHLLELLNFHGV